MKTYQETASEIITEFMLFTDWMDKYNYLIELGKALPLIDQQYKTDKYLIAGCQSQVWVKAEYTDGAVFLPPTAMLSSPGVS